MRPQRLLHASGLLALYLCALPALAAPIALPNSSPLARIAGPNGAQPARLAEAGTTQASFLVTVSSHSASDIEGDELFMLDGETWEATFSLRRSLASGLELGLELPFIVHENGILDSAIDWYHDLTGLPGGERDGQPTNQLAFLYRASAESGGETARLDNPAAGIGDVTLYAAWPLLSGAAADAPSAALRVGLRLPTGDSDDLLGNGAAGLSLALSGSRPFSLGGYPGELYGRAGVLAPAIAGSGVLDNVQEDVAGFITMAATWHRWQRLSLTLQLDSNSPLWDSNVGDLGGVPLQLVVAGEWHRKTRGDGNAIVFGFAEDLAIDRSPDIVFFFNWQQRY
ncbi:MAG: DUF3187 family protein [Pseudomonadota bacterium]